ncbi:MAG: phytoene/squalene synthase family protein [Sphingobium sp.]|nr:phytoene/squalene synthase family protein [Sphingobium sp.]MCP5399507.1 phytoene/squalene synthase family protein [Sphingomonas sp.]
MHRDALVLHARDSIARGSKSFAMASRLFDHETRERAWLLYAWCRKCDDMADGQDHGGVLSPVADPQACLNDIRAKTQSALDGIETGDPAFDGLGVVAAETGIPHPFAHDLIEGFALDAAGWRPQTTDDLLRYCYHVAGAVGLMMAVVMGVSPDDEATLDRACDLGLAFQLANIARDIREDGEAGRCYIPAEWLAEAGMNRETMLTPENRNRLAAIGSRLATLAEDYECSARIGATALPLRSAWAVLAAAGIYGDIARQVRRRGEAAWDRRIIIGKAAKLGWVAKALFQSLGRTQTAPRSLPRSAELWQRPR